MGKASAVHLVGSVPLADSKTVFRTLSKDLGLHLKRIVDGETGRRASWTGFIQKMLGQHPDFEVDVATPKFQFVQWDGKLIREWDLLKIKDGVDPDTITFETGYAADAIEAFAIFERLQRDGTIPADVKYQACAATPLASTYLYLSPPYFDDFNRAFTRHLIEEVDKIAQALPHEKICYQWDIAPEVLMWEDYIPGKPSNYREQICTSLAEVGDAVPDTIDIGYHLCYGSPQDEHLVQPKDLGVCVDMTNGLFERIQRRVQFVHMPVPKDRTDAAFFAPLAHLQLPNETEFYLGCIHPGEDEANAARLDAANKYASIAGVGSECGWGRGDPAELEPIIAAHRALLER